MPPLPELLEPKLLLELEVVDDWLLALAVSRALKAVVVVVDDLLVLPPKRVDIVNCTLLGSALSRLKAYTC